MGSFDVVSENEIRSREIKPKGMESEVTEEKDNEHTSNCEVHGGNPGSYKENEEGRAEFIENNIKIYMKKSTEKTDTNDSENETSISQNNNPQTNGGKHLLGFNFHLPQPIAPSSLSKSKSNGEEQVSLDRTHSDNFSMDMPSIGKFFRDKSSSFSSAIVKRISSLKQSNDSNIQEFTLQGLKVVVKLKNDVNLAIKGRISFYSRSNCRDCTAVRSFFREKGLKFVEINIDVFPTREKDLIERTGSYSVPQIFFNEKLVGGLVALNSLRNSGEFERMLMEITKTRCPENAPSAPLYGFDDPEKEQIDDMIQIVKILRQRLPIRDRLSKMKIVKNCFLGNEMVEVIIQHMDCERKRAIEIGKELERKHFIHHVFREHDFEDGNNLYRFLEHESSIAKCYNFRVSTNDEEPKPARFIGQKLYKIMSAILESRASDDRRHVDYKSITTSEEFRRYICLAQDLQRVDVSTLTENEKLAFFINLYNAMVIHAIIRLGCPEGIVDRRTFFNDFQYIIGGYPYSLSDIKNGILRVNRRQPYSLIKPFSSGDKRLEAALSKINPLIHFGICNGTRSSPSIRFFSPDFIEAELRFATREFFLGNGIEIDLNKRTVCLTRIIKWYDADFGQEKEILKWILNYLDSHKAGLLTHLMNDGGQIHIVYSDYNWSLNS